MPDVSVKLNGLNNRERLENIPPGMAANAVNVLFANDGEVIFSRPGKTSIYTGTNIHSVHQCELGWHFVEGDDLKLMLDDQATVITIRSGMGIMQRVFYATVGETTYFSNALTTGKIVGTVASEWGVARPARQPDCLGVSYGGMYGGDYRVAITYLGSDGQRSGTGMGRRVTVPDGGGILANNFPTPPAYCTGIELWVSSVNSADMYLYGEYSVNVGQVSIIKRICTIPLDTQFKYPPKANGKCTVHNGRIYFARDDKLYRTEPHNYSLCKPYQAMCFDQSKVKVILSAPPMLWVNTDKQLYQISNIDSPDGSPPTFSKRQLGGCALGSEAENIDGTSMFYMSHKGVMKADGNDIVNMTYDNVAIPLFEEGTMTVIENDGMQYLHFCGINGTQNPLANKVYNAAELARGSL